VRLRHTLGAIDRSLIELRGRVLAMGRLTADQLEFTLSALLDCDAPRLQEARADGAALRTCERDVESRAMRFIALYQPVATDLRLIRGLWRISGDLGRIGVEVAKMQSGAAGMSCADGGVYAHLREMALLAGSLLQRAVATLEGSDSVESPAAAEHGGEIDARFAGTVRGLLTFSLTGARQRDRTYAALTILKSMDRIADYASGICGESLALRSLG
jgi:phosphate transport system protein